MGALYLGSTSGFSGKNMLAMALGLQFQKEGYNVGYMKPVGAVPSQDVEKKGDEDAYFVQEVLGLNEDPELVTPVVISPEFKAKAFAGECPDLVAKIKKAYEKISKDTDIVIIGGSGSFFYSGKYCGVDGLTVSKALGAKVVLIDRFHQELNYDYLLAAKETIPDDFIGAILNDVPGQYMVEVESSIAPLLDRKDVQVLGVIPKDSLMGAIKVEDLAERLEGKIISAPDKTNRVVEKFLIGTMQVENFMTHFRRQRNSAILVGGDRSDLQLVALEGKCPCLVLTGNLYPNDIIISRSEALEIPIIVVRDDTYTVAKKMEGILGSTKLRDMIKIKHGAQLVHSAVDIAAIKEGMGLL